MGLFISPNSAVTAYKNAGIYSHEANRQHWATTVTAYRNAGEYSNLPKSVKTDHCITNQQKTQQKNLSSWLDTLTSHVLEEERER